MKGPVRRSRYLVMPVAAFREGEDFDSARLPVRVLRREWRRLAILFVVLFGFIAFMNGLVALEDRLGHGDDGEDWSRFLGFTWILAGVFLAGAVWAWARVDEVRLDRERVRIRRRGLIGADTREAPLSSYRGVRARRRYVEDYEVTSGTTHWDVELEHEDPGLTVTLFSRSRDEPSTSAPRPLGGDRTDWTDDMQRLAGQWSRDFGLPLLTEPDAA